MRDSGCTTKVIVYVVEKESVFDGAIDGYPDFEEYETTFVHGCVFDCLGMRLWFESMLRWEENRWEVTIGKVK